VSQCRRLHRFRVARAPHHRKHRGLQGWQRAPVRWLDSGRGGQSRNAHGVQRAVGRGDGGGRELRLLQVAAGLGRHIREARLVRKPHANHAGADTGEVKPHGEASPRLVAGPAGRLAVVWPRDIVVAGRQWPASAIRVARSIDGGRTWLAPQTVNDDTLAAPVGHNFQGAAWAGDSALVTAWLDERTGAAAHHHDRAATAGDSTAEPDATVYLARSPDCSRTGPRKQATWGSACPCCRITLARHPEGRVTAAWRQHFPGNVRDVVVADLAPKPDAPERVHEDGWVYPGCPHNGPGIAVGPDGQQHAVWYT